MWSVAELEHDNMKKGLPIGRPFLLGEESSLVALLVVDEFSLALVDHRRSHVGEPVPQIEVVGRAVGKGRVEGPGGRAWRKGRTEGVRGSSAWRWQNKSYLQIFMGLVSVT